MAKPPAAVLSGWKNIASYLGKGVRTAQRYERELRLPVHRPAGRFRAAVIATRDDLDAWIAGSPTRTTFDSSPVQSSSVMYEFRNNITELGQLRDASAQSRRALVESRQTLQQSRNALIETLRSLGANIERVHQEMDRKMSGLCAPDEAIAKLLVPPLKKKVG